MLLLIKMKIKYLVSIIKKERIDNENTFKHGCFEI